MTPASRSLKLGLALFGGGSRGAVEVGFYKALAELNIKIDLIAACSIGALNGPFIASGFPADQLADLVPEIQPMKKQMVKKIYSKNGKSCRVTFHLPAEVDAQHVCLCGEFNRWDRVSHLMTRRKDGSFVLTLALEAGRSYRYRYILDGTRWENDRAADAYAPNPTAMIRLSKYT